MSKSISNDQKWLYLGFLAGQKLRHRREILERAGARRRFRWIHSLHANDSDALAFEWSESFSSRSGVGDQDVDFAGRADDCGAYLAQLA